MFEGMELFGGVFSGRKVLVTGHTGFKGTWLSLWLQTLGATVAGYALEPPTPVNLFEALRLEDRITHIHGDIRDLKSLKAVLARFQPEIVFHLAAQSLVRRAYAEPVLTYETNVMGTVNLFESLRQSSGTRVVVNITSDKCYDNREWVYAYRENDPMGGFDPYSSSKGCAELVTSAYRNSFLREAGVRTASARAGNVVGGGDWAADRIVPDCIRALSKGEVIEIRNPGAVRPWQFVLEPLSGYLWLASRLWEGDGGLDDAWNFGPDVRSTIPVRKIAEAMIQEWGEGSWRGPEEVRAEPHEAGFLALDCLKAASLLGWNPTYDIDRTLAVTAAWYKAEHRREDISQITLQDIEDYVVEANRQHAVWAGIAEGESN